MVTRSGGQDLRQGFSPVNYLLALRPTVSTFAAGKTFCLSSSMAHVALSLYLLDGTRVTTCILGDVVYGYECGKRRVPERFLTF